jgi:hypothetical protein
MGDEAHEAGKFAGVEWFLFIDDDLYVFRSLFFLPFLGFAVSVCLSLDLLLPACLPACIL